MTIVITSTEARTKFYELLSRAERGEEIIITRFGRPVATLARAQERVEPRETGINASG